VERIGEFLKERQREGLLRRLRPAASRKAGRISFGDKEYIDLSSNDYLGLSNHPALKEAAKEAVEEYGSGSSASRLLSGDLEIYHRLEEEIAAFKGKARALVFNSGYQANVGIISALSKNETAVFSDRLNHASIIDGIRLSGAKLFRFRHNEMGHLEELLEKERPKFKDALIITETVFSMEGDRAPLKDIAGLKERYGCRLMVDEAHATGIFGPDGSGLVAEEGLADKVDIIMGTFGKALGSFGAYAAASGDIIDYLINTSRAFIYSTALPPSVIAANRAAMKAVRNEPERREALLSNAAHLRDELKKKS
jgi:8-amino-7-oxononanoate synthase